MPPLPEENLSMRFTARGIRVVGRVPGMFLSVGAGYEVPAAKDYFRNVLVTSSTRGLEEHTQCARAKMSCSLYELVAR